MGLCECELGFHGPCLLLLQMQQTAGCPRVCSTVLLHAWKALRVASPFGTVFQMGVAGVDADGNECALQEGGAPFGQPAAQ